MDIFVVVWVVHQWQAGGVQECRRCIHMSAAAQLGASGSLQQELSSFLSQYLVGGRNTMIDRHLSSYYYLQPDTMMICLDGEVV